MMPRARNIKAQFFISEQITEVSFPARLLFIGLWTLADRRGRLEDRHRPIKMALFPADSLDVPALLDELANAKDQSGKGLIQRYEIDGKRFIQIANFEKHQNPHKKETESVIPPPPGYPVLPEPPENPDPGQTQDGPSTGLALYKGEPSTDQEQTQQHARPADPLSLIPDPLSLIPESIS